MKKALTASIAPAKVLADGGTIMAGGNGAVNGIRIAGVVIEDASSLEWVRRGLAEEKWWKFGGCPSTLRILARFGASRITVRSTEYSVDASCVVYYDYYDYDFILYGYMESIIGGLSGNFVYTVVDPWMRVLLLYNVYEEMYVYT